LRTSKQGLGGSATFDRKKTDALEGAAIRNEKKLKETAEGTRVLNRGIARMVLKEGTNVNNDQVDRVKQLREKGSWHLLKKREDSFKVGGEPEMGGGYSNF